MVFSAIAENGAFGEKSPNHFILAFPDMIMYITLIKH